MRVRKGVRRQKDDRGRVGKRESIRRLLVKAGSLAEARMVAYDALALKISAVLTIDDEDFSPDWPLGSYGSDSLAGDGGDGDSDGHSDGQYAVVADCECCQ